MARILTTMLGDTVRAAQATVAKTPDLLPTLKQAGVVDAGGQGLATILEGVWRYSRGESLDITPRERREEVAEVHHKGMVTVEEEFGYEVVFLLRGRESRCRRRFARRSSTWAASRRWSRATHAAESAYPHPHTGQILDYGVGLGSLQDINIENLQAQSLRYAADSAGAARGASGRWRAAPRAPRAPMDAARRTAVAALAASRHPPRRRRTSEISTVAVAAGDGWIDVFQSLGVSAHRAGRPDDESQHARVAGAVKRCPTAKVILLPNNSNVIFSARQVPELTKQDRSTSSPPIRCRRASARCSPSTSRPTSTTNCQAMEQAIKRVQTAEITQAVRTVQIDGVNVD